MAAQHVIDEVGRNLDLPPGLAAIEKIALDQPGDDGAIAERALHQRGFLQPFLEIVAEHVLAQQIGEPGGLLRE